MAADATLWAGASGIVAQALADHSSDNACARAALAAARDIAVNTCFGSHLLIASGVPAGAATAAELRPHDAERQELACALFAELLKYPREELPPLVSGKVPWGVQKPEEAPLPAEAGTQMVELCLGAMFTHQIERDLQIVRGPLCVD